MSEFWSLLPLVSILAALCVGAILIHRFGASIDAEHARDVELARLRAECEEILVRTRLEESRAVARRLRLREWILEGEADRFLDRAFEPVEFDDAC